MQQQEKEIQALRKALDEAKDLRNRAEVKLESLERQEKEILRELEELGVEPDRLDEEIARLEQNIQSTQANVLRQINARLNPVITQVMNARNANIALDVNATLARSNTLDVTADVLTALNAALPSVSVTPLPQAAQPAQPQPQGR